MGLWTVLAAAPQLQRFEAVEPHMGTLFRIELYAPGQAQAQAAFRAAFARIHILDETLSDYQPDSELNRASRLAASQPVRVSDDLFRVLQASQELAARSAGAFDVTLGPLTHLWREARRQGRPPGPEAVAAARARCGYRKLHLDAGRQSIRLDAPGMQLDVGGIAKGYAADEALAVLTRLGIPSALVAASGDLAFSGAPPGQRGWRIGLGSEDQVGLLTHGAVSTSGPGEQHLDFQGRRYSHILNPATGLGLESVLTVTVSAPRGMLADGLATASCVLGPERARKLVAGFKNTRLYVSGVVK